MENLSTIIFVLVAIFFCIHGIISYMFGCTSIKKGYRGIATGLLTFFFSFIGMFYAIALPVATVPAEEEQKSNKTTLGVVIAVLALIFGACSCVGGYMLMSVANEAIADTQEAIKNTTGENTDEILAKYLGVNFGGTNYYEGEYDWETAYSQFIKLTNTDCELLGH